jgi:hypothetical protein
VDDGDGAIVSLPLRIHGSPQRSSPCGGASALDDPCGLRAVHRSGI